MTRRLDETRTAPHSYPSYRPYQRARRARSARSGYWLATFRLFVVGALTALVTAAALLFGRYSATVDIGALVSAFPPLPVIAINPSDLLYHPEARSSFDAALLLLAPLAVAAIASMASLSGPAWRRVMLALLGFSVAAFNLLAAFSLIWQFYWNGAGTGVISPGAYLALSASLGCLILAFGCWHLALAGTLQWPALAGRRARRVARWWNALIVAGAALLIASYFMVWGSWSAVGHSATLSLMGTLATGGGTSQALIDVALVALPAMSCLCAFALPRAPRWGRPPLALLAMLAGMSCLALCVLTLARLYLRASGQSMLAPGGALGLGASALILVALFGLLSTPTTPHKPGKRAPRTRKVTAIIPEPPRLMPAPLPLQPLKRAPTTRRVTAIVSQPRPRA
jgi:hypothetical protein